MCGIFAAALPKSGDLGPCLGRDDDGTRPCAPRHNTRKSPIRRGNGHTSQINGDTRGKPLWLLASTGQIANDSARIAHRQNVGRNIMGHDAASSDGRAIADRNALTHDSPPPIHT